MRHFTVIQMFVYGGHFSTSQNPWTWPRGKGKDIKQHISVQSLFFKCSDVLIQQHYRLRQRRLWAHLQKADKEKQSTCDIRKKVTPLALKIQTNFSGNFDLGLNTEKKTLLEEMEVGRIHQELHNQLEQELESLKSPLGLLISVQQPEISADLKS